MPNILEEIVRRRRADLEKLGPAFGAEAPSVRTRPVVPFLSRVGTILEIKRSSPSKGAIAMGLDPERTAKLYAQAGTQGISVLTERNFFNGSLKDLQIAAKAAPDCSILRKDFLLEEEEIEIAYKFGADAVLLIARILNEEKLLKMAARARKYGMTPFIEVRTESDAEILRHAALEGNVVAGVNSRDLANFHIDPLIPAAFRKELPCRAIFESGVEVPGDAAFARKLGFEGILIGEAAARNPENAAALVKAFGDAEPDREGEFWKRIAERREAHKRTQPGRPLVKICGIRTENEGMLAAALGADLLGFVFSKSPRNADAESVRKITAAVHGKFPEVLFCGVITDPESEQGKCALALAEKGTLDAVQFHGCAIPPMIQKTPFACYPAVRIGEAKHVEDLLTSWKSGTPRTLIDAKVEGIFGGTGTRIPAELVHKVALQMPLWLAGGIGPENVRAIMDRFHPELIDVSSRLESAPGVKDAEKVKVLFKEINGAKDRS